MESLRILPSKRRIWVGCIACSLPVGFGCAMVHNGEKLGWFVIILFGLGFIAPGLLLLPGATWLEMDEEGFALRVCFRSDRYLWSHITEMDVWQGVVSFKLNEDFCGNKRGQAMARVVSGYDGSIPNVFRLDPQSVLELMMEYKRAKPLHESD